MAGYAVFGRDPSRLIGLSDAAVRFYGISFGFFAQAQILLAGVVLAIYLVRRAGWRWLPAFVAVYGLSLGSELMGTAYGVPFGPYSYTDLLGVKWLGLVPALIPLSWFFMAVPAYGLAVRALGGGGRPGALGRAASESAGRAGALSRIALGSLLLLAWDLTLDPAMSEVTRYWVWGEAGPYYGMPLMNLFGWYVTGVVLMVVLEWRGARSWLGGASTAWLVGFYGANLILPLGMTLVAGMWGAAVATALVLGGVVVWASLRSRTRGGGRLEGGTGRREASSGAEVVR
ncbi:MAG: carotenoid biosynthesis protein [Gemmatimonadetes bacterium]|nr:carotenoid biosynthesis protein [Gemmatimonadota bacterium]NIQ57697.1 carotenoid biosynthesis protein [Gemmatimonadota bacterium]NIU77864.1 carotenoid biosynthesis protein [Gammaproteobacteria bacterium]NIX46980.1 carotenoid biosynthesis protein [Gemmatimonadota bacterium]NIY11338.1 carotenoid biosynthesis protein [Gemmatimonadota bacterium]